MIKHKKTLLLNVIIIMLFLSVIGGSYAFFTLRTIGNDTASQHMIVSASKMLQYTDTTLLSNLQIQPEWTTSKDLTVENIGNKDISYDLVWQTITNELDRQQDLVMEISCVSSVIGNTCPGLESTPVADSGTNVSIIENIPIEIDEIHTFTISITYINQPLDQSSDMNKEVNGKLGIIG